MDNQQMALVDAFLDRFEYLGQCYEAVSLDGNPDQLSEIEAQLNQAIKESEVVTGRDLAPLFFFANGRNKIRRMRGLDIVYP